MIMASGSITSLVGSRCTFSIFLLFPPFMEEAAASGRIFSGSGFHFPLADYYFTSFNEAWINTLAVHTTQCAFGSKNASSQPKWNFWIFGTKIAQCAFPKEFLRRDLNLIIFTGSRHSYLQKLYYFLSPMWFFMHEIAQKIIRLCILQARRLNER